MPVHIALHWKLLLTIAKEGGNQSEITVKPKFSFV